MIKLGTAIVIFYLLLLFLGVLGFITKSFLGVWLWGMITTVIAFVLGVSVDSRD